MSASSPAQTAPIDRLLIRYATAIDTKDWTLLRTCFTDDCRFTAAGVALEGADAAQFVTGAALQIDGGTTAGHPRRS